MGQKKGRKCGYVNDDLLVCAHIFQHLNLHLYYSQILIFIYCAIRFMNKSQSYVLKWFDSYMGGTWCMSLNAELNMHASDDKRYHAVSTDQMISRIYRQASFL